MVGTIKVKSNKLTPEPTLPREIKIIEITNEAIKAGMYKKKYSRDETKITLPTMNNSHPTVPRYDSFSIVPPVVSILGGVDKLKVTIPPLSYNP